MKSYETPKLFINLKDELKKDYGYIPEYDKDIWINLYSVAKVRAYTGERMYSNICAKRRRSKLYHKAALSEYKTNPLKGLWLDILAYWHGPDSMVADWSRFIPPHIKVLNNNGKTIAILNCMSNDDLEVTFKVVKEIIFERHKV